MLTQAGRWWFGPQRPDASPPRVMRGTVVLATALGACGGALVALGEFYVGILVVIVAGFSVASDVRAYGAYWLGYHTAYLRIMLRFVSRMSANRQN